MKRNTITSRQSTRACLFLVVSVFVVIGQGCTVLWKTDQSVLETGSPDKPFVLSLDSATITVVPQNVRVFGFFGPLLPILLPIWHSDPTDHFWIVISILPRNGEIWFNPQMITLQIEQGATYAPAGYSGPISLSKLGSSVYPIETFLDVKSLNVSSGSFPIETDEIVVGLMFNTRAPAPDQRFFLTLNGIEKIGHPNIKAPLLSFKKERRWHFDFFLVGPLYFRNEWIAE